MNLPDFSLKEWIFLSSNLAFFYIAYLLYQKAHYFEALILAYFGYTAINFHWNRCNIHQCLTATTDEFQIDLTLSIITALYLYVVYNKGYDAIWYGLAMSFLTWMYQKGEVGQLVFHSAWHILFPVMFYQFLNR